MIVLETMRHETVWGGRRAGALAGLGPDCPMGHLYSVFCREGTSNKVLNGPDAGKKLNDVFPRWRDEFDMGKYEYFPLTLAITDAGDNLSIQVHPNDEAANRLEEEARGKRESWYFLEAPESGRIFNGCACFDEDECDRMIAGGSFADMVDTLAVSVGDYVFVEPGTLHSLSKGSLVYEIEEGADFTYRFYDFDRLDAAGKPRELHVDKARECLDLSLKSVARRYPADGEIEEATYSTRKVEGVLLYRNESGTLECLTLVRGSALCDGVELRPGMTAMLWPGESVEGSLDLAFAARLRRGI